jgi:hypothetical protein
MAGGLDGYPADDLVQFCDARLALSAMSRSGVSVREMFSVPSLPVELVLTRTRRPAAFRSA